MDGMNTAIKGLATSAFEQIKADILKGRLRPEERLRVQGLSQRYGIGATGIREALSRLVTDGLVAAEDQRGFCVVPISREELLDLTTTRVGIEKLALSQAVQNGDLDWETNVLSSYHRLSRTPVPDTPEKHDAWALAHRQFHEALASGCKSPWLMHLGRMLYDQSERYRNIAEEYTRPESRDALNEHEQLMEAAMARDASKLCELVDMHLWTTTNIILSAVFDKTPSKTPEKRARGRSRSARGSSAN